MPQNAAREQQPPAAKPAPQRSITQFTGSQVPASHERPAQHCSLKPHATPCGWQMNPPSPTEPPAVPPAAAPPAVAPPAEPPPEEPPAAAPPAAEPPAAEPPAVEPPATPPPTAEPPPSEPPAVPPAAAPPPCPPATLPPPLDEPPPVPNEVKEHEPARHVSVGEHRWQSRPPEPHALAEPNWEQVSSGVQQPAHVVGPQRFITGGEHALVDTTTATANQRIMEPPDSRRAARRRVSPKITAAFGSHGPAVSPGRVTSADDERRAVCAPRSSPS